jgi:hypothetical protein
MSGRPDIIEALQEFSAQSRGLAPWMAATSLALRVGATSVHDPLFEADVQTLFDAGTIRLMSGGNAGGSSFYSAMLVPPDDPGTTPGGGEPR